MVQHSVNFGKNVKSVCSFESVCFLSSCGKVLEVQVDSPPPLPSILCTFMLNAKSRLYVIAVIGGLFHLIHVQLPKMRCSYYGIFWKYKCPPSPPVYPPPIDNLGLLKEISKLLLVIIR